MLMDGLLAFFSAVGVTTVVWLAAGALLRTGRTAIPGLLLVLPLRGEALAMESDVRELRRVRGLLQVQELLRGLRREQKLRQLLRFLLHKRFRLRLRDTFSLFFLLLFN